jgi:N-methylhydantoinase B
MNNLAIGGVAGGPPFAYYETIAGGTGAQRGRPGESAVHSHMTNSLNTPIEALERALPLRVAACTVRRGSGGAGRTSGGDGIVRAIEARASADFSILSDRRAFAPYGLAGGRAGAMGRNGLRRRGSGVMTALPGKVSGRLEPGDVLILETPGGGGFGPPPRSRRRSQ